MKPGDHTLYKKSLIEWGCVGMGRETLRYAGVFTLVATFGIVFVAPLVLDVVGWSVSSGVQALGLGENPIVLLVSMSGALVLSFTLIYILADRLARSAATPE